MDDKRIIELFWARSEDAIAETQKKYSKYCRYIANNILSCTQDAEECVNDAYQKAWENIPPAKPEKLSAYLGKLTRNIAINKSIRNNAAKRTPQSKVILEEAEEFIADPLTTGDFSEEIHLRDTINGFLGSLDKEVRVVFVRRYWYMSSVKDIAKDYGLSESNVKVMLMRTRKKLKEYLEREGITV